jgi:hypothetical protein
VIDNSADHKSEYLNDEINPNYRHVSFEEHNARLARDAEKERVRRGKEQEAFLEE